MFDISIKENLDIVNENIEKSLQRVGRTDKVNLIAVTKTMDLDIINEAIAAGAKDLGENKVQELSRKLDELENQANFHMIGHLQTNKVKYIFDRVKLIHSLDRSSLAKEIDKRAKNMDINVDTLIQVNVAEEESKFGLKVDDVIPFIEKVLKYSNINIRGLMTMAPFVDDEMELRRIFRTMVDLKEKIAQQNYKELSMDYLSMGMTNDYEIAIEEGSNMVRVGRAIFGKRNY